MTLKALTDIRADREDMRLLIDDIMRGTLAPDGGKGGGKAGSGASTPPRRSVRGVPPPPPPLTAADMRGRVALGQDAAGNSYHWYDMPYNHDAPVGLMGSRLYVEGPPQPGSSVVQQEQQSLVAVKQEEEEVAAAADTDSKPAAAKGKPPLPPSR